MIDKPDRFNKTKCAVDLMKKGYMCAESIVMTFAGEFGLEPEIAARISSGFALGMAQGKTCGAVTGAVMVIGLKYGSGLVRNEYSKDLCFQIVQEFSHRFHDRRKTVECDEILLMNDIDPKSPSEMKKLREKELCYIIVKDAVEILEELFNDEKA